MAYEPRQRVSYHQLEALWEFLNAHREIATGYNKSAQARSHSRTMWESVAESLNSQGEGATKDWKGWAAYWVDYKAKLKKKVAAVRASQARTGGGPSDIDPLSAVEKNFLSILGQDYGLGLPNVRVDPFPDPPAAPSVEFVICPAEVEDPPLLPNEMVSAPENMESSEQAGPSATATAQAEVVVRSRRRRRDAAHTPYSRERARRLLVESSQLRNDTDQRTATTLEGILNALSRIAQTLERIETRMSTND